MKSARAAVVGLVMASLAGACVEARSARSVAREARLVDAGSAEATPLPVEPPVPPLEPDGSAPDASRVALAH